MYISWEFVNKICSSTLSWYWFPFIYLYSKPATETYFWNICSEGGTFLEIPYLFDDFQNSLPGKPVTKKVLLENWYLFGEHIKIASGKFGICLVTKKVLLENWYLLGEQTYLPGKLVSVRWADRPSWKISTCSTNRKDVPWKKKYLFGEHIKFAPRKFGICSVTKKVLLENWYLFGEQIYLPGKLVSVRWTHETSWKNLEKGTPGKKEHIFENSLVGCFCIFEFLYLNVWLN